MIVDAEVLSLSGAGSSMCSVEVFISDLRGRRQKTLLKTSAFESSEGTKCVLEKQNFVSIIEPEELLCFEAKIKKSSFKKVERYNFSFRGDALTPSKSKIVQWYECAPVGSKFEASSKKSWGKNKSNGSISSGQNVAMLLRFYCRPPASESSKMRLSKSGSSGSEGASLEERRRTVLEAPMDDLSDAVLEAIYGKKNRSRRSFVASSSTDLSSEKKRFEPVYLDFEGNEEEDDVLDAATPVSETKFAVEVGDWNSEYQSLVEEFSLVARQGAYTRNDCRLIALNLAKLEQDFLAKAEQYGKIIISELFLDQSRKTILPDSVGGVLGGAKYVVKNAGIMFKVPDASLFLADQKRDFVKAMAAANKVCGRELDGIRILSSYFFESKSSVRVCLPLCCVIDYLGFRLLCLSILPISHDTLRYGAADAAKECCVLTSDETLVTLLSECGKKLNLDAHRVGCNRIDGKTTSEVTIYSCVDLEGHKGHDGRYYLVDTSRIMPPTATKDKTTIYFENFRAEALADLPPLSSDALSKFVSRMSEESAQLAEMQDQNIFSATDHLLGIYLKEQMIKLVALFNENPYVDSFDLVSELHGLGLNVRYLGLACAVLAAEKNVPLLFLQWMRGEALARTVKNKVRGLLRVNFRNGSTKSTLVEIVAEFLDSFFCSPLEEWKQMHQVWVVEELQNLYRFSPSEAETCALSLHSTTQVLVRGLREPVHSVHTVISLVLKKTLEYCGIVLEPHVFEGIRSGLRNFGNRLTSVSSIDVKLESHTKHLPLIERATAFILLQQATSAQSSSESIRLDYLIRAHAAVSRALHSCPNDSSLLSLEGDILSKEMICMKRMGQKLAVMQNVYARCIAAYERAILFDPTNVKAAASLAMIYNEHGNFLRAEELFLQALETDPCDVDGLRRYGDFLAARGLHEQSELFYLRRSSIMKQQHEMYAKKVSTSK